MAALRAQPQGAQHGAEDDVDMSLGPDQLGGRTEAGLSSCREGHRAQMLGWVTAVLRVGASPKAHGCLLSGISGTEPAAVDCSGGPGDSKWHFQSPGSQLSL